MNHPDYMYHHTVSSNRAGIERDGLLQSMSDAAVLAAEIGMEGGTGIYFASLRMADAPDIDIWKVDVRGLALEPDDTTESSDPDDVWLVCHDGDIGPERMTLEPAIEPAFPAGP